MAVKPRRIVFQDSLTIGLVQRRHHHHMKAHFTEDIGNVGGIDADAAGMAAELRFRGNQRNRSKVHSMQDIRRCLPQEQFTMVLFIDRYPHEIFNNGLPTNGVVPADFRQQPRHRRVPHLPFFLNPCRQRGEQFAELFKTVCGRIRRFNKGPGGVRMPDTVFQPVILIPPERVQQKLLAGGGIRFVNES